MDLWLTNEELKFYTKATHRAKQIAVLKSLQPPVKFRVRPEDNFPLVDRWQFERPDKKAG